MADIHQRIIEKFAISRRAIKRSQEFHFPVSTERGGRDDLATLFQELGLNRGAEIGVKAGEYSVTLCKGNPDIELYCIDIWDTLDDKYKERRARYYRRASAALAPYNAKLIKSTSMDALSMFPDNSLDFVYIDAEHRFDFVAQDLICWSNKVRQGGIVAGHDYYHCLDGGVVKAVDAYTYCHKIRPWYVTRDYLPSFFWVKP